MRPILKLGMLAALAMAPVAAEAQVLGQFKWAGTGSSFGWFWRNSANTNINVMGGAAYRGNLQFADQPGYWPAHGTTNFGPAVDIYCVDFLHTAKTSSTGYSAYFSNLTGPLTKTRSSNVAQYLKAAWLIAKMDTYGTSTTADKRTRAEIHAAVWNILSGQPVSVWNGTGPSGDGASYSAAGMNSWIAMANAGYTTVDANQWTVITDRCVETAGNAGAGFTASDNCSQEFLTRNVVPEPATMILLGTGLLMTLALAGMFRRPEA